MNTKELNEYIKHYLEKDKTHSAIMLTGGWGTGKSHYIKNSLVEYLKKDNKSRCVIVSLYGLKSVSEISKSIYLETRHINSRILKSEKVQASIVTGTTVIKGITSYLNVDLSASEKSLQRLYEAIDLSGKLIILEDVERSDIGILQILGYVNNLVEQDNVKVLLVANEEEILERVPVQAKNKEEEKKAEGYRNLGLDNRVFTEDTKKYLKSKEKTVSDTVEFQGDYKEAIHSIIVSFENKDLTRFTNNDDIRELKKIFNKKNLRTFIFACQKTVDLYEKIEKTEELEDDFIKAVFFGILYFSLKLKQGEIPNWDGNSDLSMSLGGSKYPLFKFCYDYITEQNFDKDDVLKNAKAFKEFQIYDRRYSSVKDDDVSIIKYFYLNSEKVVRETIKRIEARLLKPEDVSFYSYRDLVKGLIQISHLLGIPIETCKERMIDNLRGRSEKLSSFFLFGSIPSDGNDEERKEYEEFKNRAISSLHETTTPFLEFEYTPSTIDKLYDKATENNRAFNSEQPFALNLDISKFTELLYACTPEQIETIRILFNHVYYASNVRDFLRCDKDSIGKLLANVKEMAQDRLDAIQKLQLKWFVDNLEEICRKLSDTDEN